MQGCHVWRSRWTSAGRRPGKGCQKPPPSPGILHASPPGKPSSGAGPAVPRPASLPRAGLTGAGQVLLALGLPPPLPGLAQAVPGRQQRPAAQRVGQQQQAAAEQRPPRRRRTHPPPDTASQAACSGGEKSEAAAPPQRARLAPAGHSAHAQRTAVSLSPAHAPLHGLTWAPVRNAAADSDGGDECRRR